MATMMRQGTRASDGPAPTFTRRGLLRGARRSAPLALAGLLKGVTFGVLARQAGLSLGETVAMSAVVNAGTAQFVALGPWPAPLLPLALAATALLINARNLLMGATLAPWLGRLAPSAATPRPSS